MIVNGREFNFGRCLKIEFYKGNSLVLTVEHKPEINPDCYVAMDVTVTDLPSALASDKPGFEANVTIFNPSPEVLTVIASGATWIRDFANEEAVQGTNLSDAQKTSGLKAYYASRLRAICRVCC